VAARKGGSRSTRGILRRWLAGLALLSLGAGVGVLLGAVLDGPRLLVRRWTEDVQTLELSRSRPEAPSLDEFEALQTRADPPRTPARAKDPAPAAPPRATGRAAPARTDAGARPAVASAPEQQVPTPEELIAELRRRADDAPKPAPKPAPRRDVKPALEAVARPAAKPAQAELPIRPERRSGAVVQVAAYRELEAAQTLVRRLRRAGYDAYLSDQRATGPNKYRVRVQPPPGSPVKQLATTLADRGYGVWVTSE